MKQNDPRFEKKWRELFQQFASDNDDDAGIAGWSPTGLAARLRYFQSVWESDKRTPGLWLDAGCGAGTYTRYLCERGHVVLGFDYSLLSVSKAKGRVKDKAYWGAADVTVLPLADGVLDGAMCFGVTQALSSSDAAVSELVRVLKPDAEIWIDGLNAWCVPHLWEMLRRKLAGRSQHVRYEYPGVIQKILIEHGLEDIRLYWLPILPQSMQKLQWLVESIFIKKLISAIPVLGALISHSFVLSGIKRT